MENLEGQSKAATKARGSGGDIQSKGFPAENEKDEDQKESTSETQTATAPAPNES